MQRTKDKVEMRKEVEAHAVHIFKDYILEGSAFELEDSEVVLQLRKIYDPVNEKIRVPINESLFINLILFASGGLNYFYEQF